MSQFYTPFDHFALMPAIILALFGCAILLFDFLLPPDPKQRKLLMLLTVVGLVISGIGLWRQQTFLAASGNDVLIAFNGALTIDRFALFFNWVFEIASLIVVIVSYKYLDIEGEHHGEYYSLILFAQCGMFFLAAGTDLVTLFIGLELMALCFYVMVGFLRGEKRSNEAAIKYLLLGAFSSGFLVYGFSILYGLAGSTRLKDVEAAIAALDTWNPVVFLAVATTSVGLLFKISAVPFHMWAPDAYEGAPTTITAYLSVASKAASFAFLLRIFLGPLASARDAWQPLLAAVAIATMTIGNLAAISQSNIKRLLAYDMAGLMYTSPGYAVLMLVFLLSLAGIPPTAGFLGKYYIFLSLIQTHHYVLAVIATLYVAVALYYYFRIVKTMFVGELAEKTAPATSFGLRLALGITGLLTLAIGIYPEPILRMTQGSILK